MTKRVLVTGGAGFVGSHLCDHLIDHGYEVSVLDILDPQVHGDSGDPPAYLNSKVSFIQASVNDIRGRIIEKSLDVDAVIHLAAKVGVGQSMYQISDYIWNNTYGTAMLLESLQKFPVKKLIVASSMSVYGEGVESSVPISIDNGEVLEEIRPIATDEHKRPDLQSVYALTKYDQERLCLLFGRAYHVPTIALRFFNVYGTRQSLSNPYTGVMAIFASRLLNNKPPIVFEDGQQRRDFVHVSDVVEGIRLALESNIEDEVINIGSGKSESIRGLANQLASAMNKNILPLVTGQHRVGDIRHCFADISKARRLLKYEPQMSLDDGIAELVEWLKTQTAVDRLEEHQAELVEKGLLQ